MDFPTSATRNNHFCSSILDSFIGYIVMLDSKPHLLVGA